MRASTKKIAPELLKEDVEFTKNQLLKNHVDLDAYHPKAFIAKALDSLKNTLQSPITPNDFSRELQLTISKFGHRHTSVSMLRTEATPAEKKRTRKSTGPLSQLVMSSLGDRLLLRKIIHKDSAETVNAELLAINGISYQDFSKMYAGKRNGDGYNKTMDKYFLDRNYIAFVGNQIGVQDSVRLTLKKRDSLYQRTVTRIFTHQNLEKIAAKKAAEKPKTLSKNDVQIIKKNKKQRQKIKNYFGYNPKTLEYQREILFPVKGDSTIAVLKVKDFVSGNSKKGYAYIFDSIKKLKINHLILDLRNNGGGLMTQINQLYSYLTPRNLPANVYADSAKVISKTAIASVVFDKFRPVAHTLLLPAALGAYAVLFLKTKKSADGNYYYYFQHAGQKNFNVKNKYRGKLYVLANGGTFSASNIISAALQHDGKAVFVGEETGGDYNETVAGQFKCDKLKNSKTNVCYGKMEISPNATRTLKGRGVMPEAPVEENFDDLLQNRDPQLDWILKDIQKK